MFISIDDNELATPALLMDEIFGAENFVASVLWQKTGWAGSRPLGARQNAGGQPPEEHFRLVDPIGSAVGPVAAGQMPSAN